MTKREQIKSLKLGGLNNRQIAKKLNMCPSSITYHLRDDYRKRHYSHIKNKRILYKNKAIEYKGGKCIVCGYDKCPAALEFHHLDPSKKDPKITNISISQRPLKFIQIELDKCVLLCCRCHREVHAGIHKI